MNNLLLQMLTLSLPILFNLGARADTLSFDTCVNNLYGVGGLSKAEARQYCLGGMSAEMMKCQNEKFLFSFQTPINALNSCLQAGRYSPLVARDMYRGEYETTPVEPNRKNVCSITVNSSDERDTFRSQLDSKKYNWVELLPYNSTENSDRFIPRDDFWLKRACKQKIRCDILVVSGHFASTFLGSSGFEIRIEDLSKFSCDSGCKDFFSSIKQVYLFGCNTLANKDRDSRTIEQYREILIEDGVSPHQAQRIAARRYTSYDQTIRSEIESIFFNASQIFGFNGPGPTGPSIKSTLVSYLRTGDFKKTLGARGMLEIGGKPQTPSTCEATQSVLRDASTKSLAGISGYVKSYGSVLPVPAVDMITEAITTNIITTAEGDSLLKALFKQVATRDMKSRRHILCPISMTEHKELVPTELKCFEDKTWL